MPPSGALATSAALLLVLGACSDGGKTDGGTYSRERLLDPETCKECHETHYTEWSGSMHAYAAEDPVFRAMNARGQEETGGELGDFCVSCHAPLAVQEGFTTDGLDLDSVPKHLQGITCYFCHQVEEVAGTHNNPLVLANDTTLRGGTPNPVKTPAHRSEYSRLHDGSGLESSPLCGSCHDIVVPGHFSGATEDVHLERTFLEWKESVFATPDNQPQSCSACHMRPTVGTTIASPPRSKVTMPANRSRHAHTFAGVDVALTEFPERDAQQVEVQDFLDASLRIQLCWSLLKEIRVDVDNVAAGHHFPSGATQDRRVWLEVKAYRPGETEPAFVSGVVAPDASVAELDPPAMVLHDTALKLDGSPAHMFWDVAEYRQSSVPTATIDNPTSHVSVLSWFASSTPGLSEAFATSQPERMTVTVWVEPVGLDVLDDLIESGHLAPALRGEMPRFKVLPNRDGATIPGEDRTVTLEWTRERSEDRLSVRYANAGGNYRCVQSSPPRGSIIGPSAR